MKRGRPVSLEKRAAVLEAATVRFLRDGLSGTSMEAVAADAGVSKQTVFGHYGNKEGLFRAVVEAAREHAPRPPLPARDGRLLDPDDLAGSLVAVGQSLVEVVLDPRIAALRRLLIYEIPRRPELRQAWTDGPPAVFQDALARELAHLARAGRLRIADAALATRQLVGLWTAPLNVASAYGSAPVPEEEKATIVRQAVELFLNAYEEKDPRP